MLNSPKIDVSVLQQSVLVCKCTSRNGNGDFKYYVEPNSDLGAHNMAEFEHYLNRSKSRLGMLCMGNLSISAHLRCANKTNARNVNLLLHIYEVRIRE